MKKFVTLLSLLVSMSAMATTITMKTSMTCQQEDGDQWIETGIVSDRNGQLTALVVEHDADQSGPGKLVMSQLVSQRVQGNKTLIFNGQGSFGLSIYKKGSQLLGDLALMLDNGRRPIIQKGMYCYPNSNITFNR